MDLIVKKFTVRYGGRNYGPGLPAGSVIYDVPAAEADKLIAGGNGTIIELPKREDVGEKVAAADKAGAEKARSGKKAAADGQAADGLGSVDPARLVGK